MGRGIISGLFWGVLVSGLAGATASLVHSNSGRGQVASVPVQAETGTQDTATQPEEQATAPDVGVVNAPTGGETGQATPVDETAVPKPDTADVTTAAPTAPVAGDADDAPAAMDAASVDAPSVMTPQTDTLDVAPDEGTEPAVMAGEDAAVTPADNPALPDAPQTEMQPEAEGQTSAMTAPAMQEAPVAPEQPASNEELGGETPDVEVAALPQTQTPQTPDAPTTEQAPVPDTPASPATPETAPEPETAPAPAPAVEPDTARASVPQIRNLAPNVQTDRLPTIGGDADASEAEVAEQQADATDQGALIAYAAAFENPDAKPVMSVILIDDPENPVSDEVLAHLPFALSFAIDAVRDDAHAVAARYRAAGFEVLMLTNLPFGAKATDIEVAFDAYSRAIPEAVAVLDQGANGFLRGPSTATQIAGILSDRGFGLITPSKGLNSAQKAAMREGVPAALIFRELDSDGEKPSVIRRYLDRAAFRAAQEGNVIMLGHTRPETIEALVLWTLEDRAASVAMAPVSVVLTAQ